jgi:predicted permease
MRAVEMCGTAAVPVLLMILGIQLAQLETDKDIGATTWAIGFRLVLAPLLATLITGMIGMQGLTRTVSIIQWGVPTAITTMVLALQYDAQPRYVAGVILLTTLLSLVTIPILLICIMP